MQSLQNLFRKNNTLGPFRPGVFVVLVRPNICYCPNSNQIVLFGFLIFVLHIVIPERLKSDFPVKILLIFECALINYCWSILVL